MKTKIYKKITSYAIMICIVTVSVIPVSAAEPFIKVIKSVGTNTSANIYLENIQNDTAGVQFDLTVNQTDGYQMKDWNSQLGSQFTHIKDDGNKLSFYITGELPITANSLYVGNVIFKGNNITIGTTGYMKYLNSDLSAEENKNSALTLTTESGGGNSGGGSSDGGSDSRNNKTEKKEDVKTETPNVPVQIIENKFTDITSHWAEKSILFVTEKGIMNGMGDGKFEPNGLLTRSMLVKTIYNIEKIIKPDTVSNVDMKFSDIPKNEWYSEAVNWAADKKIVSGMGDNQFAPNHKITREQAAVMIVNYCKYKNIELPKTVETSEFSDTANINTWAKDAVSVAYSAGIISGKPNNVFDPQGNATRSEIASIVERLINITNIGI